MAACVEEGQDAGWPEVAMGEDGPRNFGFQWRRLARLSPSQEDIKLDTKLPDDVPATRLLGQSPYHPYQPHLPSDHPCSDLNDALFKCMDCEEMDGWAVHEKVAACYSQRVSLQKCFVAHKQKRRSPPTTT
eukprot:Sspe_Gene.33358::Locus_16287_Transcript_1_1_Confidence_1.000_Length_1318::g.33358::m.33358